ncbi:hypothetical protein CK203_055651 [Vitis vinifera]|uniref:Disease resistance protein n=1 Tax=Vitis vinifera TaxID=29760 RepID=A0A438FT75_VITVI|nr:hypothetical protein CK203_055651 [Vitis vinifera]
MHYNSISAKNTCLLEVLKIEQCSSLKSFPNGKLPSTLKQLEISDGMELESISERMMHNTMLEYLSIDCDPYLKILPECLHNLTFLSIGTPPLGNTWHAAHSDAWHVLSAGPSSSGFP